MPNIYWSLGLRPGTCLSAPNLCSLKPGRDLPETFLERSGPHHTYAGDALAGQQKKHSDTYQQGKQNTDDERDDPMPSGLDLFRSSAFLRRSDTQPEEKIAHRPIPREAFAKPADC